MRGNLLGLGARVVECGTIPAGAGEPVDLEHTRLAIGDHPRGCGGTAPSLPPSLIGPGPSPRVRGNRLEAFSREGLIGTIPAGAGEPPAHWSRRPSHRDHPRGCGGTFRRDRPTAGRMGPSPRVRGNLFDPIGTNGQAGTIPAGAGEPRRTSPISRSSRDHPRGCGGTDAPKAKKGPKQGPSPRVRGNPMEESRTDLVAGTIPAGAGEPSQTMASFFRYRDHPRGCGGTSKPDWKSSTVAGPSPRVRGNPMPRRRASSLSGTIPAGAGEPWRSSLAWRVSRDHPRGCGGTEDGSYVVPTRYGPSPRVRGNLRAGCRVAGEAGTIPAGAGEPSRAAPTSCLTGDHPRGCGGTCAQLSAKVDLGGPSPRVRGNPLRGTG